MYFPGDKLVTQDGTDPDHKPGDQPSEEDGDRMRSERAMRSSYSTRALSAAARRCLENTTRST